jgi:hypothetical protein
MKNPPAVRAFESAEAKMRLLDRFLADNEDLEILTAKLREFNLFRVLRIERAEIRHSNMLGWLLNPSETHGFGDRFLRSYLSQVLIDLEPRPTGLRIQASEVQLADLAGVEVFREWGSIDLLVQIPALKLLVVLENKIDAAESEGQLSRYFEKARTAFPNHQILCLYLTLQGDSPSDIGAKLGYIPTSHSKSLEVLERVAKNSRANIPESARMLIENYLTVLRRLTMNDKDLVSLCKQIYRKHREAIDLIIQHAESNNVLEACSEVINELCRPAYNETDANRAWFLPSEWAKYLVPRTSGWSLPKTWAVLWWFRYQRDSPKLQLSLELGPCDDSKLRLKIIRMAEEAGFDFNKSAFNEDSKYTRILTVTTKLDTDELGVPSPGDVKAKAKELWERAWPQGKKIAPILEKCLAAVSV